MEGLKKNCSQCALSFPVSSGDVSSLDNNKMVAYVEEDSPEICTLACQSLGPLYNLIVPIEDAIKLGCKMVSTLDGGGVVVTHGSGNGSSSSIRASRHASLYMDCICEYDDSEEGEVQFHAPILALNCLLRDKSWGSHGQIPRTLFTSLFKILSSSAPANTNITKLSNDVPLEFIERILDHQGKSASMLMCDSLIAFIQYEKNRNQAGIPAAVMSTLASVLVRLLELGPKTDSVGEMRDNSRVVLEPPSPPSHATSAAATIELNLLASDLSCSTGQSTLANILKPDHATYWASSSSSKPHWIELTLPASTSGKEFSSLSIFVHQTNKAEHSYIPQTLKIKAGQQGTILHLVCEKQISIAQNSSWVCLLTREELEAAEFAAVLPLANIKKIRIEINSNHLGGNDSRINNIKYEVLSSSPVFFTTGKDQKKQATAAKLKEAMGLVKFMSSLVMGVPLAVEEFSSSSASAGDPTPIPAGVSAASLLLLSPRKLEYKLTKAASGMFSCECMIDFCYWI